MSTEVYLQVLVDLPRDGPLDYSVGASGQLAQDLVGYRCVVPLGGRKTVGILVGTSRVANVDRARLRAIDRVLDEIRPLDAHWLALTRFAADYYQHGWGVQFSEEGPWLRALDFSDLNQGWAVGDGGTILHSTAGGDTWVDQNGGAGHSLYDVDFVDANHGWAVGDGGTILRYNPTLQVPDERSNVPPSSFSLLTYPNPFNSSASITYDLSRAGRISLRVFDVLGREVVVLKDGFVEAGTHHVTFDGSGFASGIYFARLDAGKFSQTKKLMLLK